MKTFMLKKGTDSIVTTTFSKRNGKIEVRTRLHKKEYNKLLRECDQVDSGILIAILSNTLAIQSWLDKEFFKEEENTSDRYDEAMESVKEILEQTALSLDMELHIK